MKLVYSLHIGKNKGRNGEFCSFRNSEELLNSLLLSATISGKHFNSCELYCDNETVTLIKEDGRHFPFTKIHTCFNELNDWLEPHNWGYAKILTYSLQKEPFVHLDSDAIIWDGLPPQLLKMKFIFQQKEMIDGPFDKFYGPLYKIAKQLNILPEEINYYPPYALNMGIFGCFSKDHLNIVTKYFDIAATYVRKQQTTHNNQLINWDQSILFEQLFLTNIILDAGLRDKVDFDTFISNDFKNKFSPQYRFSHFIANWKRNENVTIQIRKMLQMMGLDKKPIINQ